MAILQQKCSSRFRFFGFLLASFSFFDENGIFRVSKISHSYVIDGSYVCDQAFRELSTPLLSEMHKVHSAHGFLSFNWIWIMYCEILLFSNADPFTCELQEYLRFKQKKGWRKLAVCKSGIHALGLYTSDFIAEGEVVRISCSFTQ